MVNLQYLLAWMNAWNSWKIFAILVRFACTNIWIICILTTHWVHYGTSSNIDLTWVVFFFSISLFWCNIPNISRQWHWIPKANAFRWYRKWIFRLFASADSQRCCVLCDWGRIGGLSQVRIIVNFCLFHHFLTGKIIGKFSIGFNIIENYFEFHSM